ncbi:MAG: zinc-dependent metalloprotease [Spirosomaceae bacterium]|nr:zinc-dependent metalloprotease [Spirosomataceae bacterium]
MKLQTLALSLLVCSSLALAQKKDDKKTATTPVAPVAASTPAPASTPKTGPKPYKEVITAKAKTQKGLLTTHQVEDKYYFEIADSLFGKEIMAVTRISQAPTGAGYGGELANRQVIRFEKGPENKVFIRVPLYINVSPDSTKPMSQAVRNSNVEPIAFAFDIKAARKDTGVVVEVTDFFKGDNQIVSLPPSAKTAYRLAAPAADRSYIQGIKTFPINTEITVIKTFSALPAAPSISGLPTAPTTTLPAASNAGAVTMEINTSMLLLPTVPMRKRYFDSRVGYFANGYMVYGENSQRAEEEVIAVRWRLEPKNKEDEEKQKRGELIEPKKPIVFYIDPATPEQWRKYLILGVNDWQKAFEKAGWKNAIMGKELTPADSNISPNDARYSFIRYFASNIQNAYGPNIHDPRTGEILESHIGWYHNVMLLLYKWYLIQAGAVDQRAQKPKFDPELMGQLVRFVSSHEVGHTLGLRHNFGSSNLTPVEMLRNKMFTDKNGHTASIMDYARFNYVAQPEDGVTDFFPRIGDYDVWAIEWGYKNFHSSSAEDDKKALNQLYQQRLKENPRIWFGTETNFYDPRSQSEDVGDNAMIASTYGIKNLQRIVPNLPKWTAENGEDYDKLAEVYTETVGQFRRYMGHVTKYVGGIKETPKTTDEGGVVYEPTPRNLQKDAVAFLNKQLFETPTWLIDPVVLSKIRPDAGVESIRGIQDATLNNLLDLNRMARLIEINSQDPKSYSIDELFTDLRKGIWSELTSKKPIDQYRRNLQKGFVEKMGSLFGNNSPSIAFSFSAPGFRFGTGPTTDLKKSDILSLARGHLVELKAQITAAIPQTTDRLSRLHLQDCLERIKNVLEPK